MMMLAIAPMLLQGLLVVPAARSVLGGVKMMAEGGGPPPIDWQTARVVSNEALARGTMQLRIQAETAPGYKAGHIIGLEVAHPESGEGLKGPYTVTRPVGDDSFDVIYRVIPSGRKTPFMEQLRPGDQVRFGGKFGTPVDEFVGSGCDRFVGVATGAGLGPLVGFAEAALEAPDGPSRIELYCGFRDLQDVCGSACEVLAKRFPERFSWTPIISKPMACTAVGLSGLSGLPGRAAVGDVAAEVSGQSRVVFSVSPSPSVASILGDPPPAPPPAPPSGFAQGRVSTAVPAMLGDAIDEATHFHLVGNGQFVVDFERGLLEGGVAAERVTTEKYFNGKATPDEVTAAFVADAIRTRVANAQAQTR